MAAYARLRHLAVFAAAVGVAACAPSDAPERVVEARPSLRPAPRGAALLKVTMLSAHDTARRAVGVAPLAWDDMLAADALGYARVMARTGKFAHADQPHGAMRQGENLWTGTRDAYAYGEMIGHWAAEARDFINLATPAFSRTGKATDVGHYTQMVWRGSTRVGCATASNARDDYLVCRYAPAGNVMGVRAF
jgi:uncharacterized protein YkwD